MSEKELAGEKKMLIRNTTFGSLMKQFKIEEKNPLNYDCLTHLNIVFGRLQSIRWTEKVCVVH